MERSEVYVLEQTGEVCLGGFLEGGEGVRTESAVDPVLHRYLADESLERHLPDEELGGCLEAPYFVQDGLPWSEAGLSDCEVLKVCRGLERDGVFAPTERVLQRHFPGCLLPWTPYGRYGFSCSLRHRK